MKIGLLSPYISQNHGTVLQAFALSKTIQSIGVECEYVRCGLFKNTRIGGRLWRFFFPLFHPQYKQLVSKREKALSGNLNFDFLGLPDFKDILKKNKDFVEKNTPVSAKWIKMSKLEQQLYDRFIVGSDQTWSPSSLYQYSPYYLRQIDDSKKKYSYACSMGQTKDFPSDYLSFIKDSLTSFSKLSCREKSNCEMLEKLIGREVSWVVDPTLLMNREEWIPYMAPVKMPEKYIVCYILGERKCIGEYADELGRQKGLPVYYIMTRPSSCNHENVLKNIGAAEFLWLIDNCQYLVTDSFHGCIFSINFKRNVMAFSKFEGNVYDNARILDVLSSFGLESHYISDSKFHEPVDIDYAQVHRILEERRSFSLNYLKSIVQ